MKKILILLSSFLIISCEYNSDYNQAFELYKSANYKESLEFLKYINKNDVKFTKKANELKIKIKKSMDSVYNIQIKEYSNIIDSKILQLKSNNIDNISFYKSVEIIKDDSINNTIDSIKIKYNNLLKLANQSKSKNLNKFRIDYAKNLKDKLWRNNIDVFLSNNNKYINFTGGTFASNANIEDFYNEIKYDLKDLEFKRANFRWYKNADEFQYFTID